MHVVCKKCTSKIAVAGRSTGSTFLRKVHVQGNVHVGGGGIGFGPGGSISFTSGGAIGFGRPQKSSFTCSACGTTAEYEPDEIKND